MSESIGDQLFGDNIFSTILDPVGAIVASGGGSGSGSGLSQAEQALIAHQIGLAQQSANQEQSRFEQINDDTAGLRQGVPELQGNLANIAGQVQDSSQIFGEQGRQRRQDELGILRAAAHIPGEIERGASRMRETGETGANRLAGIAGQFLNPGGISTQAPPPGIPASRVPPGFDVGNPLPPGVGSPFTRGPGGTSGQPPPPLATTSPILQAPNVTPPRLPQDFAAGSPLATPGGAFTRGSIPGAAPIQGATTNPIQAAPNPLAQAPAPNLPLATTSPIQGPRTVGPPLVADNAPVTPLPDPAGVPPGGGGIAGIQQQGQNVAGLADTIPTELGNLRQSALGTLNEAAQGNISPALQNLFTDAGGARERDILELQFQNARDRTIEQAGSRGGGLDRNLSLLEGQRALGIAGQEARRTDAQRGLARNLFGVATQAGLGAPGEEAALRSQAANIFGGAEGQRQSGLQGALSSLDTALQRDLQSQQLSQSGLAQSQALSQSLAGQFGENADQFLFAQPGLFGQEADLLQNIATAPALPASVLQGLNINNPASFLNPAQGTLANARLAAQQAAAAQQAGFGRLIGPGLGAAAGALFT